MKRKILVTGGAGFIGSAVVRHLIAESSWQVINVDSLTYAGNLDSLAGAGDSPRHCFERVDVRDRAELNRVFRQHEPDAVLHLAAESHVDRSIDGPDDFVSTNVLGTVNLLEAARRYWRELTTREKDAFRFLHVSTDEVYGSLEGVGFFDESSRYAPNSPYAASKAASDQFVRAWHGTYGVPTIITNCSNNYGPYQFPEKLIPHMIIRALEGRALPVYGDGGNVRDWLYVEDHVRALLRVLEDGVPGGVYCIGGKNEKQNIEVVERICEILDELRPRSDGGSHRERLEFVPDRPGHDRRYAIDTSRIESELGWAPAEEFESGLRKTVRWYVENEAWWRRVLTGSYRVKRLGVPD